MQDVGYDMYSTRSADAVGDRLLSILQTTLEQNTISVR